MDVDEVESENRSVLAFASGRVTAGGHAVHGDPIGRQREQRMPRLDAAARPPPAVATMGENYTQFTSCDVIAEAGGCDHPDAKVACCATCGETRQARGNTSMQG